MQSDSSNSSIQANSTKMENVNIDEEKTIPAFSPSICELHNDISNVINFEENSAKLNNLTDKELGTINKILGVDDARPIISDISAGMAKTNGKKTTTADLLNIGDTISKKHHTHPDKIINNLISNYSSVIGSKMNPQDLEMLKKLQSLINNYSPPNV